jgi:hypothetical protein
MAPTMAKTVQMSLTPNSSIRKYGGILSESALSGNPDCGRVTSNQARSSGCTNKWRLPEKSFPCYGLGVALRVTVIELRHPQGIIGRT